VGYYGYGDAGSGVASSVVAAFGPGVTGFLTGTQTWSGTTNTFTSDIVLTGTVSGTGISTYVTGKRLDEFAVPTSNISLNSNKITNLADPTSAQDAATKAYVDAARSGLDVKESVKAATTANISLSGTQTIDGVSLIAGDRVLVKNQSTASDNGIYVVASGSWSRATDSDSSGEFNSGAFTFVEEGTVNGGRGYVLTTANPITLGTTNLEFTMFSSAGAIAAGTALSFSGTTLNVNADGSSITTNGSNQLAIHTSWAGQTAITTLGTITTGTWSATAISLAKGGTGGDLSAASDGSIFKKSGTSLTAATAGTDYLNNSSTIDGSTF
jgi:phage-related tail fiber protein